MRGDILKDIKYEDLNKTLAAVGKAVFVNFYYDFKDFSISKDELAKRFFRRIQDRSQIVKTFEFQRARHIFESGQEKEALRIIIESKRVDKKAVEKKLSIFWLKKLLEKISKQRVQRNDNLSNISIKKFNMTLL